MAWTKEKKKELGNRLVVLGLKHLRHDVFNKINQGWNAEAIDEFISHELGKLPPPKEEVQLHGNPGFAIFGKHLIAQNAIDDMDSAMQLPYATLGALMPDAHRVAEKHIPVGGTILSDWAIVPGWVGNDISCSVCLSITGSSHTGMQVDKHKYILENETYFGQQVNPLPKVIEAFDFYIHAPMMMRTQLGQDVLERVMKIAPTQFGTSGDGNHFVEIGEVDDRMAILSHFGSRGVGAMICDAFMEYAKDQVIMPQGMEDAPLDFWSDHGQDYFDLMNFAGDFAEQGHRYLHTRLSHLLHTNIISQIFTQHNFAWATPEGIIHRKGATPAYTGQAGVIPATMGDKTQIIIGKGNERALWSTSHGAGRTHSRGRAMQEFGNVATADYVYDNYGVHLIGGGPDEDPRAYKRIHEVMEAQADCAEIVAEFTPHIVRMADPRMSWRRKK